MLRLLSGRHRNAKILALSLALCLLVGVVLPLIPTAAVEDPSLTGDPVQIAEETSNSVSNTSESPSNQGPGDGTISGLETGDTEPLPNGGTTGNGLGSLGSPAPEGVAEAGDNSKQSSSESSDMQLFNSAFYNPPHFQVQSASGLVDSEVAVDVTLINPGQAAGYSFVLNYDPALVAPVLDQEGIPVFEPGDLGGYPEINLDTNGQLLIAAAGTQPAAIDPVRLCTLYFRLLEEGDSSLTPLEVEIYDEMGQQMSDVTVEAGNIQGSYPVLCAPVASPVPGNYSSVQRVSLRASDPADYIYFTLDESDPADPENAYRQLYSGPILVNRNLTINAVTFREGRFGEVVSFEYSINLAGISGNVTYSNLPVAEIPVKLKNENGVVLGSVNTNSQGGYAFPALRNGTYVVAAGGSGGFSTIESEPITLDDTNRQFQQNFELFKDSGTITGVVQVPEGYSPEGILVYAQSDSTWSYSEVYAEQDGSFRLEPLEPADDYQVFTRNDQGLVDASVNNVVVTAGQPTALTDPLALVAPQLATLSGTVSEVNNQQEKTPVKDMWISVYSPSTNCWGDVQTDATGSYLISNLVVADDYFISYYSWDDNLYGTLEGIQIKSGANIQDIDIPAGYQITGTVKRDSGGGELVPQADINVWVSGPTWGSAITDGQGNYTIKHLLAGTYTVEVDMWDTFDVDSRTDKTVTLDADNSATHDIILIPGGTISGTVTTNPPGEESGIVVNAYSASKNIYRRATTDDKGDYTIRGISPANDYVISAWKWPYEGAEQGNIVVPQEGPPPVVNLVLNHPDLEGDYFRLDSNRYLAMTPSIAPGKVASFKLDYKNCNPSQTAFGVTAEFVLPAGLSLVEGSVTLNGAAVSPTTRLDGNKTIVTVDLGNITANQKGSIVFQAQHDPANSNLTLLSQASIKWSGNNLLVGGAQVEIVAVDINAPSFTKPGKFTVYGKCAASAQVKIMAKRAGSADILLGQAGAEGKWWTTSVDINQAGTYQLYAIAEKGGVVSNPSNLVTVEVKDSTVVLEDVTINAGWNREVKSNPRIGIPAIAVSQGYSVQVDAVFTNPLDTSSGNPKLLFASKNETIDLSKATPADFRVTSTMSSSEPSGQQKTWTGSFTIGYDLSGDLKAYIYYYAENSWHLVPVVQIAILIDPSGIITDTHTGLPIEGVKAECEYEVSPGNWQRWPAENYGQVNPQFTDARGYYGWDVPAGKYRVRFTHPGYNPTLSQVVVVPPPKTDLNLGLTSLTAAETPGIKTKSPVADDVDVQLDTIITVEFTKKMKADTVTAGSFIVKDGEGNPIGGSISGSGSLFTFTPTSSLTASTTYTVQLTSSIIDIYDKPIEPAQWSFTTMAAGSAVINVAPQLSAYARSTDNRPVNVSFTGSINNVDPLPVNLDIQIAAEDNPTKTIATVSASVGGDGKFNASWPIPANLAEGVYQVRVWYDNQRWGNQSFEVVAIEAPTADIPNGTKFDTNPLTVSLSCTTPEAQIYYTTNGDVPDKLYTGSITLVHSATIKAIAVKNGAASEIATFSYTRTDECFIATASFGSKFVPAVVLLRQFRDQCLLTNSFGQAFVEFYYQNSPPIAHYIADRPALKAMVRGLLTPAIGVAYLALHPQTAMITFTTLFLVLLAVSISRRRRAIE